MYRVLVGLLFLLIGCSITFAQVPPQRVTKLYLTERGMLGHRDFTVTADSLLVQVYSYNLNDTLYRRALTVQERNRLLASFDRTYLSAIRSHYECPSTSSCPTVFKVTIYKGDQHKDTKIIDCQVPFLFAFSKALNSLVPVDFQSEYTEEYLRSRRQ